MPPVLTDNTGRQMILKEEKKLKHRNIPHKGRYDGQKKKLEIDENRTQNIRLGTDFATSVMINRCPNHFL